METLIQLRILVADDSRPNRLVLKAFLEESGHEVILAETGKEAIALYEAQAPDMVLMDIIMPEIDGLEATRRIRALPRSGWVPIIFLSALDRDENLVEGLEAGGDDFISKPINFPLLDAKLHSIQRTLGLQQKAADSLRHLLAVSDNVLEAIITINSEAIIISCNRVTEELFGWQTREMIGCNVSMLCPEPERSKHDSYVANYVMGGPPKVIGQGREVMAQRRDGSTFPAELSISEVRLEGRRMFIGVIRDISARKRDEALIQENARMLQHYYETTESENLLASSLMERQMRRNDLNDPLVSYWISPALHFSGDVLGAARAPSGDLYALLADATGHGLTAAISTLPLLTLFYHLIREGVGLAGLIGEINQHLLESMPVGRFVAATLVRIDATGNGADIWVGGMPEALLLDDRGIPVRIFRSTGLPLGIVGNKELAADPAHFSWDAGSHQLLLCSDGLLEAESGAGIHFGQERLRAALKGVQPESRRQAIRDALAAHLGSTPHQDDISLLLLSSPGARRT